ncbi:Arc family DNA-binding protein [Morganella morganii]|uniref:Arc family DNA-binding protein n=1 Tax=Morganella morganii TaxID=582 RepID=UPI0020248B7F|nr:Arc family DNA-binding protein [Morganella morganii]
MKEKKTSTFPLRMPEWVKEKIKAKAGKEGLSVNAAILQRLVQSLERDDINERVAP